MPALHQGFSSNDEEKVDILSLLESAGVEFIVYKIIHMLELRDICSVLQGEIFYLEYFECLLYFLQFAPIGIPMTMITCGRKN